jgi:hypothetical protein
LLKEQQKAALIEAKKKKSFKREGDQNSLKINLD